MYCRIGPCQPRTIQVRALRAGKQPRQGRQAQDQLTLVETGKDDLRRFPQVVVAVVGAAPDGPVAQATQAVAVGIQLGGGGGGADGV